jgi:hypothetical protein
MVPSIGVLYLARGVPAGLAAVRAFFASYEDHDPGAVHSLRVLVKGWEGVPGLDGVRELAGRFGADIISLGDDGLDFGAYFRAVALWPETWICLLNTNSRIQAQGWLAHLHAAASRDGVGAAGATGSWESVLRDTYLEARARRRWLTPRDVGKLLCNWACFPGFPNPHLRSNALLTRTSLFKEFSSRRSIPATRRGAHILEAGRIGFSAFLRSRRLAPVVCGADGGVYYPPDWPVSATFRSLGQRNLLVADRQTTLYASLGSTGRHSLQLLAWGRSIDAPA